MKYIALLRGINVGGNHKVEMKKLKALFESLGFADVSTYINSGNIIFGAKESRKEVLKKVETALKKTFAFAIPVLVKTELEMARIASAIPKAWSNDTAQRSDIAYLFPAVDREQTIAELPVKKEFMDIRYTKGAIIWNIKRENVYKSRLNKIIGHKLYQSMTMRNINTARFLGGKKGCKPF